MAVLNGRYLLNGQERMSFTRVEVRIDEALSPLLPVAPHYTLPEAQRRRVPDRYSFLQRWMDSWMNIMIANSRELQRELQTEDRLVGWN